MKLGTIFRRFAYAVIHRGRGKDDPPPVAESIKNEPQPDPDFSRDSRFAEEQTPFFLAVYDGKFKTAEDLLAARPAFLEMKNKSGLTPLQHLAVCCDKKAVFEFMQGQGADLETRDAQGDNVTMRAIRHSALAAAAILIGMGGKVDLADPVIEAQLRVATYEMDTGFLKAVGDTQKSADAADAASARAAIESIGDQMQGGLQQDIAVKTLRLKAAGAPHAP